jgi:hypothetical protein
LITIFAEIDFLTNVLISDNRKFEQINELELRPNEEPYMASEPLIPCFIVCYIHKIDVSRSLKSKIHVLHDYIDVEKGIQYKNSQLNY